MGRKKRPKTIPETLRELLEREDLRELEGGNGRQQIMLAVLKKALSGDLKSVEFILELLGERGDRPEKEEGGAIRIELGPGVEDLAK